jgi:hypothetical protein
VNLPEAEHEYAVLLNRQLDELRNYVYRMKAGLALFDFSSMQIAQAETIYKQPRIGPIDPQASVNAHRIYRAACETPSMWIQIAISDVAMTIWAFHQTLVNIRRGRDNCPTIKAIIPGREVEDALDDFSKYFLEARYLRNVSGHSADLAGTVGRMKDNALSGGLDAHRLKLGPKSKNNMISGIDGRKVFVTAYNKIIEFEISQSTLDKLNQLCKIIYELFLRVENELRKRRREQSNPKSS